MKSMQRQFGKMMTRSADDSNIAVLLHEFNHAEMLLSKMADSTGTWRDSWTSILTHQERMLGEFELLYTPIAAAAGTQAVETPQEVMDRTLRLHADYLEMRQELLDELNTVDEAIVRPVLAAKDYLEPMKRTIKKREDRKLDYERNQNKYDSYANKVKRSDRDNASMAKAEGDLANSRDIYTKADDTLRERLPLLLQAVYSLIPPILATVVQLQNTIVANYYTILYTFASEYQFENPPPPMEQIVEEWEQAHMPICKEIESMGCLVNGKAIRQQQQQQNSQSQPGSRFQISRNASYSTTASNGNGNGSTSNIVRPPSRASSYTTATTSYSNGRRSSTDTHYTIPSQGPPSPEADRDLKPRIPSISSASLAPPSTSQSQYRSPSPATTPRINSPPVFSPPIPASAAPVTTGYAPAGPKSSDYFSSSHSRFNHSISSHSATPITPGSAVSPGQQSNVAFAAAAAAASTKKKPPPPPKPKAAAAAALFVTALYDFGGQGDGDLVFSEGDRIRVVQKTESTDDWWQGELRGVRGSFPANYVE